MPNRIIRDGILSSESVNSLSWPEEVFYRRLMSVVDDHGRFHAQPKLLRAACYPLHIDKVSDSDIGKWLSACETAGLVRVYPASDGKRYVELVKFGQQVRSKSKFPEASEATAEHPISTDINCSQPPANAHLGVFVFEGGKSRKRDGPPERPDDVEEAVWRDWVALRKRKRADVTDTVLEGARREAGKAGLSLSDFLREWVERGSQGLKADWVTGDKPKVAAGVGTFV